MEFLKNKISLIEKQMKSRLEEITETFQHSGNKGTSLEAVFREFLLQYLPRRLDIGNGEIVSINGHRSKQTDIIIVNEDHPFTFNRNEPGLFFIEGVCAAGEIKKVLTSQEFEQALRNSQQFKKLEINPGAWTTVSANDSDLARYYKCPHYFLVAFESQLNLETILKKIIDFINKNNVLENKLLDGVFLLYDGWIINFGDGKGSFSFKTTDNKVLESWVAQKPNSVLFDFLGWLSAVMPRFVRYEPILPKYLF